MFKRFVFALAIALVVLAAMPVHPAYAQETVHPAVTCSEGTPCVVLTQTEIASLGQEAADWNLYLSYGEHNFKYTFAWVRPENPAGWYSFGPTELVPSKIRIPRDSFTSVPQMGIYWWKDQLVYHQPGRLLNGEINTLLTSPGPLTTVLETNIPMPNWNDDYAWDDNRIYTTYAWDGSRIYTWWFVPELTAEELVLHILDLRVGFLTPVTNVPTHVDFVYDSPADVDWVPGEELAVVSVNTNARAVPETSIYEGETYHNYESTLWRATWQWTDNFVFRRAADGSLYRISDRNIMTSRACAPDEQCYTTGYYPKAGENVYVYPYTLWDIADSKEYGDPEYANLWLFNVSPARDILPQDQVLINQRLAAGEVELVEATVIGPLDDGKTKLINTSQGPLDLPISYMPPIGTKVIAYIYNENANTPYTVGWRVMALFDLTSKTGKLWFFNSDAEYGRQFDAETYNVTAP